MMVNARSPTLETVAMIEAAIKKYSGIHTKRHIWQQLDKKVMWQTYISTIKYLKEIHKIIETKDKKLLYIWNPKIVEQYAHKKSL